MSNPEYVEPDDRGRRTWKEVLIADRWRLAMIGALLTGVALYFNYEPDVPRWLRTMAVSFGVASLIGYAPAARLVKYLFSPPYKYLIDHDAREGEYAVWQVPPDAWRELTVDGELYHLRALEPAYSGRNYDPEENTVEGDWRAASNDVEFIREKEKITEIREELEPAFADYIALRIKQSTTVRSALRDILNDFTRAFEEETIYSGDSIAEAIDRAVGQLDDARETDQDDPTDDRTEAEPNVTQLDAAPDGGGGTPDGGDHRA